MIYRQNLIGEGGICLWRFWLLTMGGIAPHTTRLIFKKVNMNSKFELRKVETKPGNNKTIEARVMTIEDKLEENLNDIDKYFNIRRMIANEGSFPMNLDLRVKLSLKSGIKKFILVEMGDCGWSDGEWDNQVYCTVIRLQDEEVDNLEKVLPRIEAAINACLVEVIEAERM